MRCILTDTFFAYRYNTLGMDASLRYLLVKSKLRSSIVEDNVQKTSFSCSSMKHFVEIKLQHAALTKHEIHYVLTHPSLRAGWIGYKGTTKFAHLQILCRKSSRILKSFKGKFCLRTRRSAYYQEIRNSGYARRNTVEYGRISYSTYKEGVGIVRLLCVYCPSIVRE